MEGSRNFTDAQGVEWNVWEVKNPSVPPKLAALLGTDRRRASWLVFEAPTLEKRRLTPYPEDWRTLSDGDLELCCERAVKVPPAPARRSVD
jgi:hypothetical protein